MNQKNLIEDDTEVAPPAWQQPENIYGSVEGLDDEELASPSELERAYYQQLWGPVLQIPIKKQYSPAWDVRTNIDYNAFASVDFDSMRPQFDKARYKAEKLREKLKDILIMISILNERIKSVSKYKVLKYVRMGYMDIDDINNWDMRQLAAHYLRALKIKKEIVQLQEASGIKRRQAYEKWLKGLG